MTPATEFPKLLEIALAEVKEKTLGLIDKHQLSRFSDWTYADGVLTFRNPGVGEFRVPAQLIGSHHPAASRWRWAWDDATVPPAQTLCATQARDWGRVQGIDLLTSPTTAADETLAWKLTAFAARLAGHPGIYRGPGESGVLYFAFVVPTA